MQTQTLRPDPLFYDFEMSLRSMYYPLGFSLEVITNSRGVLAAAQESWGQFEKTFNNPPLEMRVGVLEGLSACPVSLTHRQQRNLRTNIADAENFSVSDPRNGFSFAWLTRATVENRPYLRWHFIEAMSWDLLEAYLTPVHAACVSFENHGVLLCGDSRAGKSSLAYACAKRGWTYLADDSSSLVRGREGPLVVGNPFQIRFRESAVELFPELQQWPSTLRATGEMAIEVPTACLPQIRTTAECLVNYIVFLNRSHSGPARLSTFPRHQALQWFEQIVFGGEPEIVEAHKAALRNLLAAQILEMRYSDLAPAVDCLEDMVHSDV